MKEQFLVMSLLENLGGNNFFSHKRKGRIMFLINNKMRCGLNDESSIYESVPFVSPTSLKFPIGILALSPKP